MTNDDSSDHGWETLAAAWETHRRRAFDAFRSSSDWLVDAVNPGPGQIVLELAAGPGETGFLAAERVGNEGRVISTDLAPTMVEAAERGAAARGLSNVECRVIDAQAIDLADESVDAVMSRLGFMLVPDPSAAFREVRRVLRGGGSLAYTVIGAPDRNPWLGVMMGALVQNGHQPAGGDPSASGGPFSLSTAERNSELLAQAGFEDVSVDGLSGAISFEDADDYWDFHTALSGPVKATVGNISSDEQSAVRSTLTKMMAPFADGGSFSLPTHVVAVRAR